ncbi:hypothetical protein ACFWP0_21065 [Achromobacter sp. NPDC058515]|uniref:hypothetical protein n=1 Tax=Achromobacter sp. NPDC058515 TaxID=3346533 RepID=UPI0036599E71
MSAAAADAVLARYAEVRSLDRWKTDSFMHAGLESFERVHGLFNGVHTIIEGGQPIDLYLDLKPGLPLAVMFTGAQDRSKVLTLPAFAGMGAVPAARMSRIFVSDPTLYLAKDLTLGWYGGSADLPLQAILPKIIGKVADYAESPQLVFGGSSGGGFASLYYSSLFPGSLAIAANPQTSLVNYYKGHVLRYASSAFGIPSIEAAMESLPNHLFSNLIDVYKRRPNNYIVYLQNINDAFHLQRHCHPFLEALGLNAPEEILAAQLNSNFLLQFENWGPGHIGPKPDYWNALLTNLLNARVPWSDLFESHSMGDLIATTLAQVRNAREGAAV